jgi:Transposase DDE domain
MTRKQKRVRRKRKQQYRVRNWATYNRALVGRGDLELWFCEEAIAAWRAEADGSRGAPRRYSDLAIECALTIKAVFHLPLRATQGLMQSIVRLLGLELDVMNYTTLSRRAKTLLVRVPSRRRRGKIHLVVDATGLKVYGEGEWHVRTHGKSKRRQWRKVHIAVDEGTLEIKAVEVTASTVGDKQMVPELLEQVPDPIGQVSGDKGYDYSSCHWAINARRAKAVIPPRRNARVNGYGQWDDRDEAIRRIRKIGRKKWKQESGYHRRSLVETTMYRLKQLFGERLSARKVEQQATEVRIRCAALNRMTGLGMPKSVAV